MMSMLTKCRPVRGNLEAVDYSQAIGLSLLKDSEPSDRMGHHEMRAKIASNNCGDAVEIIVT